MTALIAMVVIDSGDDPRLVEPFNQAGDPRPICAAVVAALPRMSSVVAILPEEEGKLMLAAHMIAVEMTGCSATEMASTTRNEPRAGRRRRLH